MSPFKFLTLRHTVTKRHFIIFIVNFKHILSATIHKRITRLIQLPNQHGRMSKSSDNSCRVFWRDTVLYLRVLASYHWFPLYRNHTQ